MSHDLKAAEHREIYLTDREMWRYTQQFLMHSKHSASYKFVLMKAILECLPEISKDGHVTFLEINKHVTKIYWNLVITNKLLQSPSTQKPSGVEQVLKKFQEENNIPDTWNFDHLPEEQKNDLIKKVNSRFKINVFGSLYGSFDGTIYSFNLKEEWIQLASPYIEFFARYKTIIMNVTNYQMAVYLEKFNSKEAMENILTKIEFVSARESLKEFQSILLSYGAAECFYCKKPVRKTHVDHFIPWSYVQNDVLWNFVLACPTCNTSKNNKIAHPRYLDSLIERNNSMVHEQMESYDVNKLTNMYEYAIQNGFQDGWEPPKK